MSETTFTPDVFDPVEFFGINNCHVDQIGKIFPKLKIVARGDTIRVIGDDDEIASFGRFFNLLLQRYETQGAINEADIRMLSGSSDVPADNNLNDGDDILVHGRNGLLVKARTPNQRRMVGAYADNDLIFAVGPAGTGKTYTAVALAVRALRNKEVKRIILTRPAVEAGENLGFLPGDLKDKLDPYLQPLYDALWDMIPAQKLTSFLDDRIIEIAPLAFMRGRTLDHAFVILDEAQNATISQMKMFLTRMGKNAKFMVTGDITQVDLPRNQSSGLVHSIGLLRGIRGIEFIFLDAQDIIRHHLVTDIIQAYSSENGNQSNSKK